MDALREYDPELFQSPWWCVSDPARSIGLRVVRPLQPMTEAQSRKFWEPLDEETQQDVRDRVNEGRGAIGIVSRQLMEAIAADRKQNSKASR